MRCHNCLRKITDANPSSSLNKWGKALCDHCGDCEHGVKLNQPCGACVILVRELLAFTR